MAKTSKFVLLEHVLVEIGYIPETVDIHYLSVLLIREGLKTMISVSPEETVVRFYDNKSLREYIRKHIWSCVQQRVDELFNNDIRKDIDISHLEQMLITEGLPYVSKLDINSGQVTRYFHATAALDAAIRDLLHLDL